MSDVRLPVPDPLELAQPFYADIAELGRFSLVSEGHCPQPYRQLLAHHEHMTVTVEAFHRCKVDVQVLARQRTGSYYTRKILLTRQTDGRVVQFGIPRLNLNLLDESVRREIEAERLPLGRVLIEHNVLREVRLAALWRVIPGPDLRRLFHLDSPRETYGRTAIITCNSEPAIELLEIVTPENG